MEIMFVVCILSGSTFINSCNPRDSSRIYYPLFIDENNRVAISRLNLIRELRHAPTSV